MKKDEHVAMNDQDRARCTRLFGADPDQWPEPYRSEAALDRQPGDDLNAMILAASAMPTDEGALTRRVFQRLASPQARPSLLQRLLPQVGPGMAIAGFAGLLLITPVAIAKFPGTPLADPSLSALTFGDPMVLLLGTGFGPLQ